MTELMASPESVEEIRIHRTLTSSPAGLIQRRNVYTSHYPFMKQYRLTWNTASKAEKDEVVQLLRDTRGSGTFTWKPTGTSTAATFRFISESITWEAVSAGVYSLTVLVEETR